MDSLRRDCGARRIDWVRKEVARNLWGGEKGLDETVKRVGRGALEEARQAPMALGESVRQKG